MFSKRSAIKMIQLVVFGLVFSAVAINAHPPASKIPPPNAAAEARRLVHQANWASVGTISTQDTIVGYPMVTPLSMADSKIGASSTGQIFFYLMGVDIASLNSKADNRVTFMFSDAQEGECNKNNVDPWSHQCPRTMISGQVRELDKGSEEHARGLEAFLSRHPTAADWGSTGRHGFYLCTLDITNVIVFSGYGGYRRVTPEEYNAGIDSIDANRV